MTSASSKAIPFVVLAIVIGTLTAEVYFSTEINLEAYLPLLIPLGLGGAGKAVFEKAIEARKALPKNIEDIIKEEIRKNLPDKTS